MQGALQLPTKAYQMSLSDVAKKRNKKEELPREWIQEPWGTDWKAESSLIRG